MSTATPPRPTGTDPDDGKPQRRLTPAALAAAALAFGLVAILSMKALMAIFGGS